MTDQLPPHIVAFIRERIAYHAQLASEWADLLELLSGTEAHARAPTPAVTRPKLGT